MLVRLEIELNQITYVLIGFEELMTNSIERNEALQRGESC